MMKRYFLYIFLAVTVLACQEVHAQGLSGSNLTEQWFQQGTQFYQQGNYVAAKQALQRYLNKKTNTQNAEEAQYMLACCSYELQEQGRLTLLQRFLRSYPSSRYRYRVWGLIGSTYYFDKNYTEALKAFEKCKWNYLDKSETQDFLFRRSLSLMEAGKLGEAEASFQEVQRAGSRYTTDCTYYLAYLAYERGALQEALQGFLSLEGDRQYGEWSASYAADLYLKTKQYEKAVALATHSLPTTTTDTQLWAIELERVKGEALFHLERYSEAIPWLKEYLSATEHPSREARYALGVSYLQSEAYSLSVEQLQKVTPTPDALAQNAWLQVGRAELKMKHTAQAKEAFSKAAAMNYDPTVREEAAYNHALAIYEDPQSDTQTRVRAFEVFLAQYPASPYRNKATTYLSEVYVGAQNYEAALRLIEGLTSPDAQALQTKQKLLFQLGTDALKRNDYDAAIQHLTRALELAGADPQTTSDAYYWRGEAYYRSNRPLQAEKDFLSYLSSAREKSDSYPLAYYNLGYIAFNKKEYDRATTYFSRFLSLQGAGNSQLKADAYNRLGDCYYHVRNFTEARNYYDRAAATDPSVADYALYQTAFMVGVQKNYAEKIQLLNRMLGGYPHSTYRASALYEKGRAYIMSSQPHEALPTYAQLIGEHPKTEEARKAAIETGLLHYQSNRYPEAITAYKRVIEMYPDTEEAAQALRDLKSVYTDTRQIQEYVAYASGIGQGQSISVSEQDSLLFESAELAYQQGDRNRALKELEDYTTKFPQGLFAERAQSYLTMLYVQAGEPAKALGLYAQTEGKIKDARLQEAVRMAVLDAAYALKDGSVVERIAHQNLQESGAKAHYLKCELQYDAGHYEAAEKLILDFIDRGSDYGYWVARHFVLLSDTFLKLGRTQDAKQYLESLKNNYKTKDDIQERIATRLRNLN